MLFLFGPRMYEFVFCASGFGTFSGYTDGCSLFDIHILSICICECDGRIQLYMIRHILDRLASK